MNRNYRIIWSKTRNAFIVTHEKARTHGKSSSTRKTLSSLVAMALTTMVAAPAKAANVCPGPGLTTITTAQTAGDECILDTGDSLVVNVLPAAITGAVVAVTVTSGATATSITNSGLISGTQNGINLSNSAISGSITNNAGGTISGSGNNAIFLGSSSSITGSITNSGNISGDQSGIYLSSGSSIGSITNNAGGTISGNSGAGIDLRTSSILGSIANSGTISGSTGISLQDSSTLTGDITNSAGGNISGVSGIYLGNSTINGNISNSGTINGTSNVGIRLDSGSSIGNISNSGTISGGQSGIYLSSGSSIGSIINNAGGTISGSSTGIQLTSSTVSGSITNSGTITGINNLAIRIGGTTITGSITNNAGGAISGSQTGIYINNNSTVGSISNSGDISAGYGISVSESTVTGSITNSGTITADNTGLWLLNSTVGSINNSGSIFGGRTGIELTGSSSTGSITNSGTISGGRTGIELTISTVINSITNNAGGTISGGFTGIELTSSTISGSITNSGSISGGTYAVYADASSTLPAINITGNNTAQFTGDVLAQNTAVAVKTGATFTGTNAFDVGSFTVETGATFNTGAGTNTSGMSNGITTASGFSNAGTVSIAEGVTSTLTGNYTQTDTGTLKIGASSNANYGRLAVTGTATLPVAAKIDVNVNGVNTLASGNTLAGVITAGTLSASTFTVTDNSALFNFSGSVNGSAVDLAVAAASSSGMLNAVTSTGNTAATGAATELDSIIVSDPAGPIGSLFTGLTTQQAVSDAVVQTLPLMVGGMSRVTFNNRYGASRVVQARQEDNNGLSSGDAPTGERYIWIKPIGSWADQKDRDGALGYDANTYGLVLGADGKQYKTHRLGIAFAYTHSNVDSNTGAQTAKVNSYQFMLYGSKSLNNSTEFNWQAGYGHNENKGKRHIAFVNQNAQSNYDSSSIHVGAGIGRTMKLNPQMTFTPSFRADFTSVRDDGYTETGAGALNLAVNGRTTKEMLLTVDGKAAHALSDKTTLMANMGVGYDTQAKQSSITSSFAGGGAAFTTLGIDPSSTRIQGGLGMLTHASKGVKVAARYDVEARSGFTNQSASVKLRMPF